MDQLAIFRSALQGALGGVLVPAVIGSLLKIQDPGGPPTYNSEFIRAISCAILIFGGSVGAVSGVIIGWAYSNGHRVDFPARLAISVVVSTFFSICLGSIMHDSWVTVALCVVVMVLMIGVLPALTTTVSNRPKETI